MWDTCLWLGIWFIVLSLSQHLTNYLCQLKCITIYPWRRICWFLCRSPLLILVRKIVLHICETYEFEPSYTWYYINQTLLPFIPLSTMLEFLFFFLLPSLLDWSRWTQSSQHFFFLSFSYHVNKVGFQISIKKKLRYYKVWKVGHLRTKFLELKYFGKRRKLAN